MHVISIDLEMNQPSGKIIQLGYIISDVKTKTIKVAKSLTINPQEILENSIIELTGITQEQVDNSENDIYSAYHQMCLDIEKFQVSKHPLQWGLDHYELRNQLQLSWKDYIFNSRAHDIKSFYQLYQMSKPNTKTISGLKKSIENLGGEWSYIYGNPHNALADAHNTLLIYWKISDKLRTFDEIERAVKNVNQKKI